MHKKPLSIVVLLAVVAAVGGIWLYANREKTASTAGMVGTEKSIAREDGHLTTAEVGTRLREDGAHGLGATFGTTPDGKPIKGLPTYGTLKPLDPSVSPQAKSAVEAFITKTHPERLSCAIMPGAFDAKKWAEDAAYKAAYLATPEPARCYQTAQPSKDTQRIALASPAYVETLQSQPVELRVKATPGMPVTFTSFDAASFTAGSGNTGSQLTTQTVVADDNGIAEATLLAGPGVIDDCRVIASCPVDAGLAKITVHARLLGPQQQIVPGDPSTPTVVINTNGSTAP